MVTWARRKRALIGTIAVGLMAANVAFAESKTYVFGIRGHEHEAQAYCASTPDCELLRDTTREFENENTFVRVLDPLVSRSVQVLVPESLTADQLMEMLIKIDTSVANGARSVVAVSPSGRLPSIKGADGAPMHLDLRRLIATAGATHVVLGKKWVALSKPTSSRLSRNKPTRTLIVGDYHPGLRAGLSEAASVPSSSLNSLPTDLSGTQVLFVAPSVSPVNTNFFKILEEISDMRARGAEVILITSYLPYARSDKMDQAGVAVTGRLVADLIETAGTNAVAFVRAHAPQSQGFFSIPTFQVTGRRTITSYLRNLGVEIIISPDAGFQKDATLYADELGVGVAVINKQRNPETGESKLHDISGPPIKGRVVAIIDDETASGGTLAKAAEFLRTLGAERVYAVVTHLAGVPAKAFASPFINELVVTDTLPASPGEKLKVLQISQEIADTLKGIIEAPVYIETRNCAEVFNK